MEKYVLQVCRGTACHVRKSGKVLQALFDATGTAPDHPVSEDGLFEVQVVSCLEMCGDAPVVMINGVPEKHVTEEYAAELVQRLRKEAEVV